MQTTTQQSAYEHDRQMERAALQRQSAKAVEEYLVAAIDMLDRRVTPEHFERDPGLLGDLVKAMAIQHQADMQQSLQQYAPL